MRPASVLLLIVCLSAGPAAAAPANLLVNGDFETGDLTGWKVVEGQPVASDKPEAKNWPGAPDGKFYFYGGRAKRSVIEQRIVVGERARGGAAVLSGLLRGNTKDRAMATLSVQDADGRVLAHATTRAIVRRAWGRESIEVPVPPTAGTIRVRILAERIDGKAADGCADALTLTLLPSLDAMTLPKTGQPLSELPIAALGRLAETAQDARLAHGAARALSRRGGAGWPRIASAVRRLVKDERTGIALRVLGELADGPEDDRRTQLRLTFNQANDADIRRAVLAHLAPFYPRDAEFLHAQFRRPELLTVEVLRELASWGLPDEYVHRLLRDVRLAETASAILRERENAASPEALAVLAQGLARDALATSRWRATLDRWTPVPDWGVVSALTDLLGDEDADLRRGAHLLLLGVSGRSLTRDRDVWRSWIAANRDDYVPARVASAGHVEAAVLRGQHWLLGHLAAKGRATRENGSYKVGATALCVYALLASGVSRDDPVVQRMLAEVVLAAKPTVNTYTLGVVAMLLEKLDATEHRQRLQEIANTIVAGQHAQGGWSYECYSPTSGKKLRQRDMSNTQYAILGLRAARRGGIEIPRETWERAAARIRVRRWNTNKSGLPGWAYRRGKRPAFGMTGAGVGSLAICLEAVHGRDAARRIAEDADLRRGLSHLGMYVLDYRGMGNASIYRYHALERACALTATRTFSGVDWYTAGAQDLLACQEDAGQWSDPSVKPRRRLGGYGVAVETAYALLFLRRATTPVDPAAARGEVDCPGKGPRHHAAAAEFVPAHSFVTAWHVADRLVPWNDYTTFVALAPETRRAITDSALRSPLLRSKEERFSFVDLVCGRISSVARYAARRVVCDAETSVKLLYGSDDSIRVWVDDRLVLQELAIRTSAADQGSVPIDFPAGETTLLVEVSQQTKGFSLHMRFETPDGSPLRLTDAGRLVPFESGE